MGWLSHLSDVHGNEHEEQVSSSIAGLRASVAMFLRFLEANGFVRHAIQLEKMVNEYIREAQENATTLQVRLAIQVVLDDAERSFAEMNSSEASH
jgi:hypothetical protein